MVACNSKILGVEDHHFIVILNRYKQHKKNDTCVFRFEYDERLGFGTPSHKIMMLDLEYTRSCMKSKIVNQLVNL